MAHSMYPFNKTEYACLGASLVWAYFVSDYVREFFRTSYHDSGEAEAFIAFGLWGVFLWWLSKRIGTGWSVYWFAFALVSFAPFADHIDATFGGILGLKG